MSQVEFKLMIKMQVFLREDQKKSLKSLAARTGKRESDLVRQSVDLMLERSKAEEDSWRNATRGIAGLWKGRDQSELDAMRSAIKRRLPHVYGGNI